jgi:hypothetical protein
MTKFVKISLIASTITVIVLFLIVNLTLVNRFLPGYGPRRYCADKGAFYAHELYKGHDPLYRVILLFDEHKVETNQLDLVLYRRFERKWWQVWNWLDFMFNPRWDIPYAASDEDT